MLFEFKLFSIVLFAARRYTTAVDMWSIAVIMAELLLLAPLFPGTNDIDQMYKVFQIMGSPSPENWKVSITSINYLHHVSFWLSSSQLFLHLLLIQGVEDLPDYHKVSFRPMTAIPLPLMFPHVHVEDVKFMNYVLQLDPANRLSARELKTIDHYFYTYPLPCAQALLPIELKSSSTSLQSPAQQISKVVPAVEQVDKFKGNIMAYLQK